MLTFSRRTYGRRGRNAEAPDADAVSRAQQDILQAMSSASRRADNDEEPYVLGPTRILFG